jgi:hypothetical protein
MTVPGNRIEEWIGKHLWNIVTVIAIGSGAYFAAQTKTGMAVDQLRLDVAAVRDDLSKHDTEQDARLDAGEAFHRCATRHLDMLEHGIKAPPACDLGDKE